MGGVALGVAGVVAGSVVVVATVALVVGVGAAVAVGVGVAVVVVMEHPMNAPLVAVYGWTHLLDNMVSVLRPILKNKDLRTDDILLFTTKPPDMDPTRDAVRFESTAVHMTLNLRLEVPPIVPPLGANKAPAVLDLKCDEVVRGLTVLLKPGSDKR